MRRMIVLWACLWAAGGVSLAETARCPLAVPGAGLAAPRLSADARARTEGLALQDLLDKTTGRYTMRTDDGVSGHWGLDAVKARCEIGPKPCAKLRDDDGTFQCERIVFADTGTGAAMMMLTQIPREVGGPGDELNYFGKSCWSADGSAMLWVRSARASLWGPGYQKTTEAFGPMLVDADGTRPRIAFGGGRSMKPPICSPTKADAAYAWTAGKVVELNLRTGKVGGPVGAVPNVWHLKVSPDGRYVMTKSKAGFWVASTGGAGTWDVKLDEARPGVCYPVHDSYRFLPAETDWIMYWYERSHPGGGLNKEGFRLRNFKTNEEKIVGFRFDWNHGDVGRYLGYHTTPYVTRWNGKAFTFEPKQPLAWPEKTWHDTGPWYSVPVGVGGYAVHWPDDRRWAYSCNYKLNPPDAKYLSDVTKVFAAPLPAGGRVNRFRVCYNNLWGRTDRWGVKSVCLIRPNISPDGTKLLFNSNVFGPSVVFMVVCAKPAAPVGVAAAPRAGGGVKVSWSPPEYGREIAGYHVYRSDVSGRGYRQISREPVAGTSFIDAAGGARAGRFYAVRSVERSRLESPLSVEAACGPLAGKRLAVFCEADGAVPADLDAPSPDALWMAFDGFASNLHFIWQRRPDKPGKAKLAVHVRRGGRYYVVARVKGRAGAAFTIAGQAVAARPTRRWTWARSATAAALAAGRQAVEIASSTYGSCLDCFYLAEDEGFDPAGRVVAQQPEPLVLKARADGPCVKLTWSGPRSSRWHHYNVYASDRADFRPSQATLIASPDRATWLDWQVRPGRRCGYKVTQVTLDGLESAGSNGAAAEPSGSPDE